MSKEQLKGGKADNMSVSDIAKKHGVSPKVIEKEIEVGMGIESEHTPSKAKQREVAKDHTIEDDKYYTDPKTGLITKEKEAEKRMEKANESKRFMALAGIKEGDKKFLNNESFSESKDAILYPEGWKEMDGMFMGPNRITQEKLDAIKNMMENEKKDDLIIHEFEQSEVEPGEDDHKVYKIRMPRKKKN
jgi:hypothetical protein